MPTRPSLVVAGVGRAPGSGVAADGIFTGAILLGDSKLITGRLWKSLVKTSAVSSFFRR